MCKTRKAVISKLVNLPQNLKIKHVPAFYTAKPKLIAMFYRILYDFLL